jgi:hypothetical protein
MPASDWSTGTAAAVAQPAEDEEAPQASDDAPPAMAAATGAIITDTPDVRGPEEFIAPSEPPPPATTQPTAVSGEEELMWLGDEFEAADLEVAAEGWRGTDKRPVAAKVSPVLELSDAELAQLAEDEGWDLDEVEAIRRLLGRPSDAPSSAMAAPETPAGPTGSTPPTASSSAIPQLDEAEPAGGPSPQSWSPEAPGPPSPGSGSPEDPDWLEGRGGPAADAYRRLRKLFPS